MLHQHNYTQVDLDRCNIIVKFTQFDVLREENFSQYEGLRGTTEFSAKSWNTLDQEKPIDQ